MLLFLLTTALAATIHLVAEGPLQADGLTSTPVLVQVEGGGERDRIRVRAEGATAGRPVRLAPGVWRVPLVVEPTDGPGEVQLEVRVRGAVAAEATLRVPVRPATEGRWRVALDPPEVPAGGPPVTVTLTFEGRHALPEAARRPLLAVTAGRLGPLQPAPGGAWTATWTPPVRLDQPVAALLTAVDPTAPEEVTGMAVLPITIPGRETVEVGPGRTAMVVLGDETIGPLQADRQGRIAFPVVRHPARATARVQVVDADGRRTEERHPLDQAPPPQVAFAPLPAGTRIPAGERRRLRLQVRQPSGQPWSAAPLRVEAPVPVDLREEADGWYALEFEAPTQPGRLAVEAVLDPPGQATARARQVLEVVPGRPRIQLRTEPRALQPGARDFEAVVIVRDAGGRALPGRRVRIEADPARPRGGVRDEGDGLYRRAFTVDPQATAVRIEAGAALSPSRLPPAELLVWADPAATVVGDPLAVPVRVLALDAFGLPVPDLTVDLALPVGDGVLPASVRTGRDGLGHATYRVGVEPGPVAIEARAGPLAATFAFWQSPPDPPEPTPLPHPSWQAGHLLAPVTTLTRTAPGPHRPGPSQPESGERTASPPSPPASPPPAPAPDVPGPRTRRVPQGVPIPDREPWLRVHADLLLAGQSHAQSGGDPDSLPPSADWNNPFPAGMLGAAAEAAAWLPHIPFGARARVRLAAYRVDVAGTTWTDTLTRADLLLAWRTPLPVPVEALVGYHRSDTVATRYTDPARTDSTLDNRWMNALMAGARTGWRQGRLGLAARLDAAIGNAMGIGGGLEATWDLPRALSLHLAADLDGRRYAFSGGELDGAVVRDRQVSLRVGVGYRR